jgi:hypothetical protein
MCVAMRGTINGCMKRWPRGEDLLIAHAIRDEPWARTIYK